jgi:hypothetical protein
MCWGFCIGKGWYYYLDQLCSKLDLIQKETGILVSWTQIKEKYASGRFYNNIRYGYSTWYSIPSKYKIINIFNEIRCKIINKFFYRMSKQKLDIWINIIQELISNTELFIGHICEETGRRINGPIVIGGWYFPLSEEGFLISHPDRKDVLEEWKKYEKEKEKINNAIIDLDDKGEEELKKFLKVN